MIRKKWCWDFQAMTLEERSLFHCWKAIIQRCTNPKCATWKDYGGRGIRCAPEYMEDFARFAADVGMRPAKGLDLDRRDNNRGYEPGNLRWVTHQTNVYNTRRSRMVTIKGVTKHFSVWADENNISRGTLHYRINMNWPEDRLLEPCKMMGRALSPNSKRMQNGETKNP